MAIPSVATLLYRPGYGWADVSACTDVESSVEITDSIESPSETNVFVAPDVQVKIHAGRASASEFQLSWFDSMQPESTDYYVRIDAGGTRVFMGFILPSTLQIDDAEKWVSFTAAGMGAKLARTVADSAWSLKRETNSGWYALSSSGNKYRADVVIAKGWSQSTCEYATDDVLEFTLGGGATFEVKVITLRANGAAPPYSTFTLVVEGMTQPITANATIVLVTPYARNVQMQAAVNALFSAAGLPVPSGSNYNVTPITGAASPFASVPNLAGLDGYPGSVIGNAFSNYRTCPVIGTSLGTFIQYDPPLGQWAPAPGYLQGAPSAPIDWTDSNTFTSMDYVLYGQRFEQYEANPGDPNTDYVYVFWTYWLRSSSPTWPEPHRRFGLAINVSNMNAVTNLFSFGVTIVMDESNDGITWTRMASNGVDAGATETNLHNEIQSTCGIATTGISTSRGKIVFTHPTGGNSPCDYALSFVDLVALDRFTLIAADTRGAVNGNGGVFQTDNLRGDGPHATFYGISEAGIPFYVISTVPLPTGFLPNTLTYNDGDGYWYALRYTDLGGVELLSYSSARLDPRYGYVAAQIIPAGGAVAVSYFDLTCIRTSNPPAGAWPMVAMVGGQVWWIAYSFSGLIPYCDIEGLSCGDALAQLAVIVDGQFFVNALEESHFLSRAITNGSTIATGTGFSDYRIDDAGCISIRRSSVYYKSFRYVTVVNERDSAITGAAGDKNFVGTEQHLEITNRFVVTLSMARALAEHLLSYLGRKLQTIEVEHELDGRRYELGRSCTAVRAGVLRSYQIIESTPRPTARTVRVLALEL